ncbi:hypothetical protein [Pleurocapsa sp. PCC 7319]|uniref:hypothetical protein n=1 Tax=Pleurocapsa sp. PCC 7319 TaxID=118161 RepID=UPI0003454E98|nr:hypothetical protein [Pleurocapsa sp. PCC 7319]
MASVCLILLQSCNVSSAVKTPQRLAKLVNLSQEPQKIPSNATDQKSNNIEERELFNQPSEYDRQKSDLLTDTAKLLAGMRISNYSQLAQVKNLAAWSSHIDFLSNAWSQLESQHLAKIRYWQQTELSPIIGDRTTVLYPFSRADFLHTYTLFPHSKEYILIDSYPVGNLVDFVQAKPQQIRQELQKARTYLYHILSNNSLRTEEIHNLQTIEALPALCVLIARSNNRIVNIEHISLNEAGIIIPQQPGMLTGVKITFLTPVNTELNYLYYFSSNLSNQELAQNPELSKFIDSRHNIVTYLKSAAYLMHFDRFSSIKELILSRSKYLLQDDSGVPLSDFNPQNWNFHFYGKYSKPAELFGNQYQPELWKAYNSKKQIKSLDFVIGNQLSIDHNNLILIIKKNKISK